MTTLREALAQYVKVRRALGTRLVEPAGALGQFVSFLEGERSSHITTALALRWAMEPQGVQRATWARRLSMVRQFATWLNSFDPETEPLPRRRIFGRRRRNKPHILTDAEVGRLMTQAARLRSSVLCHTPAMPEEISYSSYVCDCGHQIDFSENTVSEVKQKSQRKRQWLMETCKDPAEEHVVVFEGGKMVDILCPDDRRRQKKAKFTKKQGQYLSFIFQYTNVHGVSPAEHEMQRHFGVSPASVHQMIITLGQKGLIERTAGLARSIRVLAPPRDLPR